MFGEVASKFPKNCHRPNATASIFGMEVDQGKPNVFFRSFGLGKCAQFCAVPKTILIRLFDQVYINKQDARVNIP